MARLGAWISGAAAVLAMAIPAAAHADWHKSFVIGWYEIPNVYTAAALGENEPDENCPFTLEEPHYREWMKTAWRTDAQVDALFEGGKFSFGSARDRGPRPGMNIYRDPTVVPDPGFQMVVGNKAVGFDLDGNPNNGFTSADGRRTGIDNNLYRVMGCHKELRGSQPLGASYNSAEMRMGNFTILYVISGKGKDPMNDPTVTVGIYAAKEAIIKDSHNEVAADYSYRIDPDPRYMTVFEARSVNGVITPRQPLERMNVRDQGSRPYMVPDMELLRPQIEITLKADGTMESIFGGYRNWKQFYWGYGAGGSTRETVAWVNNIGLWYALERMADAMPDPATGKMTAISAAYRQRGTPAFVITPDTNREVQVATIFTGRPKESDAGNETFNRAAQIRALGGDANFQLEGGAAAWPRNDQAAVPPAQILPSSNRMAHGNTAPN